MSSVECGCMSGVVNFVKSTLVLVAAALYRVVTFMIFLSASIGPSVLLARLYNNISGLDPMPDLVEAAICMTLVALWAEFSVGFEKKICGDVLRDYKHRYPATMSLGRFVVHFIFFMLAYCQLYIQFEMVHTVPVSPPVRRNYYMNERVSLDTNLPPNVESDAEDMKSQELHSTLFLLALAYLVFVTTRAFHNDLLNMVGNLPVAPFSILSNCMLRIGFAVLHGLVNVLYFLPCIAIAVTAKGYRTPGNTTYFQLTFSAGLCGMVGALFELNRPWPQRRGRIPCLFYENNLIGKNLLGHVLVVAMLVGYFRPFRSPKVPEHKFDSSNPDVIFFCMCVSYSVLHLTKVSAYGILTQTQDFDEGRIQLQHGAGMVDLNMPNVLIDRLMLDENQHQENPRSGAGGDGGSSGGMCARCTNANACGNHHNRSPEETNPGNANNNNNDQAPKSQPPPIKKKVNDDDGVMEVIEEAVTEVEEATAVEEGQKVDPNRLDDIAAERVEHQLSQIKPDLVIGKPQAEDRTNVEERERETVIGITAEREMTVLNENTEKPGEENRFSPPVIATEEENHNVD